MRRPVRGALRHGPLLAAVLSSSAFLVVRPPVGDLWAARARAAAAADGVGLHYWFSWFAGVVPGHYSVLAPLLTQVVRVEALGAAATVAITPLVAVLVRGSRRPLAATWVATVAAALNLWSGRVPFAVGVVVALLSLALVLRGRLWAALLAALTALVSPVAAVFLGVALVAVLVHRPALRAAALAAGLGAGAVLVGVAAYFGSPGTEDFAPLQVVGAVLACVVLLAARPDPPVRTVVLLALVTVPIVAYVPNGLGSNVERLTWLCLPVAVVATARAVAWRVSVAAIVAVGCAAVGSSKDLWVAAQPQSDPSYYAALIRDLDHRPDLANYRVEVVPDGAHVAATVLLGHAALARGYETQADLAQNGVLLAARLDAATYRRWLDRYAVAYVLLNRHTLFRTPEDALVRRHRPSYLRPAWSDAHLTLFAVERPTPIVDAPAHIVDADQSNLEIRTLRPCAVTLRVHWSRFLRAQSGHVSARLERRPDGYVRLVLPRAGRYVLHA